MNKHEKKVWGFIADEAEREIDVMLELIDQLRRRPSLSTLATLKYMSYKQMHRWKKLATAQKGVNK